MRAGIVGVLWCVARFPARNCAGAYAVAANNVRRIEDLEEKCVEGQSCGGQYYRMGVYCQYLIGANSFDSVFHGLAGTGPMCSNCPKSQCRQDGELYDSARTKARNCYEVARAVAGNEAEIRASLYTWQCGIVVNATVGLIRILERPLITRAMTKATIRGLPTRFEAAGRHRVITMEANTSLQLERVTLTGGYDETIGGGCVAVGAGSVLTLFRSAIVNCSSLASGGAIQTFDGVEVLLVQSIVAYANSLGSGGAINLNTRSRLELQDGSVVANSSSFLGGGVYASTLVTVVLNSSSRISNCYVIGGLALSGGGITLGSVSSLMMDGNAEITDSMGDTGGCIYGIYLTSVEILGGAALRRCVAGASGAAIAVLYHMELHCQNAVIEDCYAANVGGSVISANDEDTIVSLTSTTVRRCSSGLSSTSGAAIATTSRVDIVRSVVEDSVGSDATIKGRDILLLDSRIHRCRGGACIGQSDTSVLIIAGSVLSNCVGMGAVQSATESAILVTNSTFSDGVSDTNGGAVSIAVGVNAVFEDTLFLNNTATTGQGGAIFAAAMADVQIRGSRLEQNSAMDGGAVALIGGATLSLSGMCAFLVVSVAGNVARSSLFYWVQPLGVSMSTYVDARRRSTWIRLVDTIDSKVDFCLTGGAAYELYAADASSQGWEDITWQATFPSGEVRTLDVPKMGDHVIKVANIPTGDTIQRKPCELVDNFASNSGGAIYMNDISLIRAGPKTVFNGNVAANNAGAIYVGSRCIADISDASFEKNAALRGSGGAVCGYIFSSTSMAHVLAHGNRAGAHGGFTEFNIVHYTSLDDVVMTSNVAEGSGGALYYRECRSNINYVAMSTFSNNTSLNGCGGGCATSSSVVDFSAVVFQANAAMDGGGLCVAQNSEIRLLDRVQTANVKIVVDWTNTTARCPVTSAVALSCDWSSRECSRLRHVYDCSGCVCYDENEGGAENYFELASPMEAYYGQPAALALAVYEYEDLPPGNWTISAHAIYEPEASWYLLSFSLKSHTRLVFRYGGALSVFVNDNVIARHALVVGAPESDRLLFVLEDALQIPTINFRVSEARRTKCQFVDNHAKVGGGGCFWDGEAAPKGLAESVSKNNSAAYGDSLATPARFLVAMGDGAFAPSGGPSIKPLRVVLEDAYNQRVALMDAMFATAIVTAQFTSGASVTSNIAVFSKDGVADFDDLVVTFKPASSVNLSVFSSLSSLERSEASSVLVLRGCLPGEVDAGDKCEECPQRMYWSPEDMRCHDCTRGMACRDQVNVPLAPDRLLPSLRLDKGFMRQSTTSDRMIECHGGAENPSCPSGNGIGCSQHAVGPTCRVCRARYYRDNSRCRSCGKMPSLGYLARIVVFAAITLALMVHVGRMILRTGYTTVALRTRPWLKLSRKWRLIFVAVQVLASVPSNFPRLIFPPMYNHFLNAVAFLSGTLLPANCLPFHKRNRATFYDHLTGMIVGPLVACAFLTLLNAFNERYYTSMGKFKSTQATERREAQAAVRPTLSSAASTVRINAAATRYTLLTMTPSATAAVILVTFVMYPTMSHTIVSTFWCVEYDSPKDHNVKHWYLQADLSLRCAGHTYASWRTLSACAVFTHVLGVPLFYLTCLFNNRDRLNPEIDGEKPKLTKRCGLNVVAAVEAAIEKRHVDVSINHLSLLFSIYRPQFWYWEVMESIRRFVMTSLIGILSSGGEVTQVFFALILSLISVRVYSQYEPFIDDSDNLLAEGLAVVLAISFFCTLFAVVDAEVRYLGLILTSLVLFSFCVVFGLVYRDMNREVNAISKVRMSGFSTSRRMDRCAHHQILDPVAKLGLKHDECASNYTHQTNQHQGQQDVPKPHDDAT